MQEDKTKFQRLKASITLENIKKNWLRIIISVVFMPFFLGVVFFSIFSLLIFLSGLLNVAFPSLVVWNGKEITTCSFINNFLVAVSHSFTAYLFFCFTFRWSLLNGKLLKKIALFATAGNVLFVFYVLLYGFFYSEKEAIISCRHWDNYWRFLFEYMTSSSMTMFYIVFFSIMVSYICLCVYSDKYAPPLPEKAKKLFLRVNSLFFYMLTCSYFIFFLYYVNIFNCDKGNKKALVFMSRATGIYGYISQEKIDYKCPSIFNH